ncbi:DUF3618 domain-containing protein [Actinokineospora auranticolor]|uniref:Uncharacterized protein DUF3618 n=1 Tax=Actinokineospora auranticolor TaxID=155976 RepID=A0A2S6H056_9PSEU|nr:DUF3618 domain-containing protein [Actinokineospora auranticolor]PPK70864.1 uncharacterized protein DUF3618 [Actinokineospora auranticolor]
MSGRSERAELREEIEEAREELAETVDALAAKTEVGRRVGEKADEVKGAVVEKADQVKDTLTERAHEAKERVEDLTEQVGARAGEAVAFARRKPVPVAVVAALLAGLVGLVVWLRSR